MTDKPIDYQSPHRPVSPETRARGPFTRALEHVLRQPSFMVVAVMLLIAALGLNAAVGTLRLHFKKEAVPLKRDLGTIPARFGPWVQVSQDKALDREVQDILGTDKYIFRDYVDERLTHAGIADEFRDKSEKDRRAAINRIRAEHPRAVVSLSVTYYTGMVDTVAHVPDRCVTADGYEPKSYTTPAWPIASGLPASAKVKGNDNIEVRFINFEDQTGSGNVPRSIAYFFQSNGKFIRSPLGVRQQLANLFEKRGYYAKIECMTTEPDTHASAAVLTDFLTHAMPEIDQCLPDWKKAK